MASTCNKLCPVSMTETVYGHRIRISPSVRWIGGLDQAEEAEREGVEGEVQVCPRTSVESSSAVLCPTQTGDFVLLYRELVVICDLFIHSD